MVRREERGGGKRSRKESKRPDKSKTGNQGATGIVHGLMFYADGLEEGRWTTNAHGGSGGKVESATLRNAIRRRRVPSRWASKSAVAAVHLQEFSELENHRVRGGIDLQRNAVMHCSV